MENKLNCNKDTVNNSEIPLCTAHQAGNSQKNSDYSKIFGDPLNPGCKSVEKNFEASDMAPSASTNPSFDHPEGYITSDMNDTHLIKAEGLLFDNETIRKGFIRKVYSILMCQLLVTVLITAFFVFHKPTQYYFHAHREYFFGTLIFTIILVFFMVCCTNIRRKAPMNYIFLFVFTLAESFLVGIIASLYSSETILIAAALTVAVCLALTIFAFQTKWDFTTLNASLFIALLLFTAFGISTIFLYSKILSLIYATCGVLLFSLYLIHDTQLMMGGKHKYTISPEEYIFGALNLYLDVIRIFLHILSIRV
ncbi:hypothetical protein PV328_001708 [Microctonus aethiopoides]|uniref:Protein lifeguard 1 n=1 Tax=Microctonus aethiopoides TaxID=144406 RepID=A0AA39FYS3_9HYME|nr:hypothetical protein PV328_001708 [Microctonus aethiopoides]